VPLPDGERLATLETKVAELQRDLDVLLHAADKRSDRVRELEGAVKLMIQAQKLARQAEERQYRRLELRLSILTVIIGIGAIIVPVALAFGHP
jgi:hypothetical protein